MWSEHRGDVLPIPTFCADASTRPEKGWEQRSTLWSRIQPILRWKSSSRLMELYQVNRPKQPQAAISEHLYGATPVSPEVNVCPPNRNGVIVLLDTLGQHSQR
jgi:hypothetical protein